MHKQITPRSRAHGANEAVINITNLRLRTYIGFNPEERLKQQDVILNISIQYQLSPDCMQDKVEAALDYKVITKAIIKLVEEGRFLLLERLVSEVLSLCSKPDCVTAATVKIDKPHALRFADSVSLTLTYRQPEASSDSLLRHFDKTA